MTDEEIVTEAATRAAVLLSKDIDSVDGHRFFTLARILHPADSVVLSLAKNLETGVVPQGMRPSTDQDGLIRIIRDQGVYLLKKRFRSNRSMGRLSLLYLLFADAFIANDSKVVNALAYLASYGVTGKLPELLEEEWNLKHIYSDSSKPEKDRGPRLEDTDTKVARESFCAASGLLAQDPHSKSGLALLDFARYFLPGDVKGVLLAEQLKRIMPIKAMPSRMTSDKLRAYFIKRGGYYLGKTEQNEYHLHMAALYIRVAECFEIEDDAILYSLEELEKHGSTAQLDELVQVDLAALTPRGKGWADTVAAYSDRAEITEDSVQDTDESLEPITSFDKDTISRFRTDLKVRVTSDKEKGGDGKTDYVDHVQLRMAFENKTKLPIEELQIIACVIGKKYMVPEPEKVIRSRHHNSVIVPPGKSQEPMIILEEDIRATVTKMKGSSSGVRRMITGYEYKSHFVVVKDSAGTIIHLKAKDSKARKFAVEWASGQDGSGLGLTSELKFDRYGNRIFER